MAINMNRLQNEADIESSKYKHHGATGVDDDYDWGEIPEINEDSIDPNRGRNLFGTGSPTPSLFGDNPFSQPSLFQNQQQLQPQTQTKSAEETLWAVAGTSFKVSKNFIWTLLPKIRSMNLVMWWVTMARILVVSLSQVLVSVILRILGRAGGFVGVLMGAGVFGLLYSYPFVMTLYKKALAEVDNPTSTFNSPPTTSAFDSDDNFSDVDDEYEDYIDESEDDYDYIDDTPELTPEPIFQPLTKKLDLSLLDAVLDTVDVPNGLVTRQYIWDKVMGASVLTSYHLNFNKEVTLNENSNEFLTISDYCVTSVNNVATGKSDEEPYVKSVAETLYCYIVDIVIPKGLNVNEGKLELEIASYFRETESDDSVYAKAGKWRGNLRIRIFKGDKSAISLRDVMHNTKDFILNPDKKMPLVLGVQTDGEVLTVDFDQLYSFLATGIPRSGKSLFLKSVVFQLMLWNSPDDMAFYFIDPKSKISDWYGINTPHVKSFVDDVNKVLSTLQYLVRVEGPRRKEIIGKAGCINLNAYKVANPDAKMPVIVVVIDEAMTIAELFRNEDIQKLKAYNGLLRELVSQLPAAGIRVMLVPHIVRDAIISKTITQLIPCRSCMMGSAEDIKNTLDVGKFPLTLKNQGDMAIKVTGRDPMFLRGAVISLDDNETKIAFDFVGKLWKKINPEYKNFGEVPVVEPAYTFDLASELSNSDLDGLWDSDEMETIQKYKKAPTFNITPAGEVKPNNDGILDANSTFDTDTDFDDLFETLLD